MPKLGFDMAEGTLVNWTKAVGDTVSKGDVIAEIETDKATIEIEAQAGGTLLKFLAEPGDVVEVGAPIAYVGAEGEQPPEDGSAPAAEAEAAPPPSEEEAEAVAAPEPPEGAPGKTEDKDEGEARPQPAEGLAEAQADEGEGEDRGMIKASPIARRIAEERGIDLRRVKGTGPGGRIVKKDVESYEPEAAPAAPAERAPAAAAPAGLPGPSIGEVPSGPDVEVIDISRLRQRIGQRMVESKLYVPHFYVTTAIDVTELLDLRKQLNASITDEERKISVNDLVVKATALALRAYPNLNSHYYGDKIVRHNRINIGIAVALPDGGLMNVVARDADKTALGTMAVQNRDMIARAREGKVRTEDVTDSTFSVSNLGPYAVEHFSAIINPPEAGILAVSTATKTPVVLEDDTIGVRMIMRVTVSVDHRVSDGAEGAEFLKELKDLLENPMRLLM
ncbi:MAG: 2-oxo acid dehydrogenase subunit E2 [Chloroflexi bacterium]|nr:2-oxo acid dehydrogenase subunit E2 [Chloroflexota bacterium]